MNDELSHVTAPDIIERISRFEPRQLAEVIDFIDFLAQRKFKRPPLVQFLNETPGAGGGLEEVRRRLAKISGKMSEATRELRDERG
jgi:hypothetical protein